MVEVQLWQWVEPRENIEYKNAILDALNSPLLNDNDIEKSTKSYYILSIPVKRILFLSMNCLN